MPGFADYFPYETYRPHQKEMLAAAETAVTSGRILMIDAPTGSGKSSLIASMLGAPGGRKILVAVRSNSQLEIFLNELQKIRLHRRPDLKFSYIFGKNKLCPLFGDKDFDESLCKNVRGHTDQILKIIALENAEGAAEGKAKTNPFRHPKYLDALEKNRYICPYYAAILASQQGFTPEGERPVFEKISEVTKVVISPDHILEYAGKYCPHRLLWLSLKEARVVVLNYHYLVDCSILKTLLEDINCLPTAVDLLLDEAHNIGEIVKDVYKRELSYRTLNTAERDFLVLKKSGAAKTLPESVDALSVIFAALHLVFDARIHDSPAEQERYPVPEWLNPEDLDVEVFLSRMCADRRWGGSIDNLLHAASTLVEEQINLRVSEDVPLARVYFFVQHLATIQPQDPYYVFLKKEYDARENRQSKLVYDPGEPREKITFEVRVLDPGDIIADMVHSFHSAVLCSGTLFPLDSYRRYYFSDSGRVDVHAVPNAFPKKNRKVLYLKDYSSAFAERSSPDNIKAAAAGITGLCGISGNVGVFFTSYGMLEQYKKLTAPEVSKSKKIFAEPRDAGEAKRMIAEFMSLPEKGEAGMLFGVCGGKWFEGLDFKGNLLNAVMVLGLPLAPPDTYQKKVNSWFERKFGKDEGLFIGYILPCMNKAVQALGRVLRTKDDRGVLVLGDRRFSFERYAKGLPSWMKKELSGITAAEFRKAVSWWRRR